MQKPGKVLLAGAVLSASLAGSPDSLNDFAYWRIGYSLESSGIASTLGQIADNTASTVVHSNIIQDFSHLAAVPKSKDAAGNSVLNLPQIVNVVLSDVSAIAKLPLNAHRRRSQRIEVCAVNLSEYVLESIEQINPDLHVGIVFDRTSMGNNAHFSTNDTGINPGAPVKFGFCQPVYFKEKISESLALERLSCINRNFFPTWNFWAYNCGGYTRDILRKSGLVSRSEYNSGIGSVMGKNTNPKMLKEATEKCDRWIQTIPDLLFTLETGKPIGEQFFASAYGEPLMHEDPLGFSIQSGGRLPEINIPVPEPGNEAALDAFLSQGRGIRIITPDLAIQLVISAVRGGHETSIAWLKGRLKFSSNGSELSVYYKPDTKSLRKEVLASLKEILTPLSEDQEKSLRENFPEVAALYESFLASKL